MTRSQENNIRKLIDEQFAKYNLTNKDFLYPKDIEQAFGYSRQILHNWCKDEKKALDFVVYAHNRRKFPTSLFRNFLIRKWITEQYPNNPIN